MSSDTIRKHKKECASKGMTIHQGDWYCTVCWGRFARDDAKNYGIKTCDGQPLVLGTDILTNPAYYAKFCEDRGHPPT